MTFANLTPFLRGFRTWFCEFHFGERYFLENTARGRGDPGRGNEELYDQILSKAAINGNDSTWIDVSYIHKI